MGYTHYFYTPTKMDEKRFEEFVKKAKEILKKNKSIIGSPDGKIIGEYIADKGLVSFNGIGEESYETLYIAREQEKEDYDDKYSELKFNFCKTVRKNYDPVVVEVLKLLKVHFPEVQLSSDGGSEVFG